MNIGLVKRCLHFVKVKIENKKAAALCDELLKLIDENLEIFKEEKRVLDPKKFVLPKEISSESSLALFTDGACRGNPGPGAWGAFAQNSQGEIILESSSFDGHTTNNKMELKAVIEGLRALIEFCHDHPKIKKWNVFVYTDSKYVVNGMEQWVIDWKRRGWKKADNKAPENVDLWMELDKVAKDPLLSVKFSWVKGHAGHPQNEYCDEMCNKILDAEI